MSRSISREDIISRISCLKLRKFNSFRGLSSAVARKSHKTILIKDLSSLNYAFNTVNVHTYEEIQL